MERRLPIYLAVLDNTKLPALQVLINQGASQMQGINVFIEYAVFLVVAPEVCHHVTNQ